MQERKPIFNCFLVVFILLAGMCLEEIRTDSCFSVPVFLHRNQAYHNGVLGPLSVSSLSDGSTTLLPHERTNARPEGGLQEQEITPQQTPALGRSVLPVHLYHTQWRIGPTLKILYHRVLCGLSLNFIVGYIQCQGGTISPAHKMTA